MHALIFHDRYFHLQGREQGAFMYMCIICILWALNNKYSICYYSKVVTLLTAKKTYGEKKETGHNFYLKNCHNTEPTSLFHITEPTLKEVEEVVKAARTIQAKGPSGVSYVVFNFWGVDGKKFFSIVAWRSSWGTPTSTPQCRKAESSIQEVSPNWCGRHLKAEETWQSSVSIIPTPTCLFFTSWWKPCSNDTMLWQHSHSPLSQCINQVHYARSSCLWWHSPRFNATTVKTSKNYSII